MSNGKVLIIVGDASETLDTMYPYYRLQEAGFEPVVAAPEKRLYQMVMHEVKPGWTITKEWEGYTIEAQIAFADINPEDYEGIMFSGGRAPEYIRYDEDLVRITRYFFEHNKPIASVCHGVEIPAYADCVKGRRMATVPKCKFDLEVCGGIFVNEPCVVDGNLVSGRTFHDNGHYVGPWIEMLTNASAKIKAGVSSVAQLIMLAIMSLVFSATAQVASADEESAALKKFHEPVEKSVDKALDFLAKSQKDDGMFPGQYGDTTAVAALVGMSFLSKGHTPGLGPYGANINRCIDLVIQSEKEKDGKPNGYLVRSGHGKMYAHCISTLFLSEVSGMVDDQRQSKIDDVLPRATSLIVKAQNIPKHERFEGGWRYEPHSPDADLSLTGWAVMALRSARLNGAQIPDETIARAVQFIIRCQPKDAKGEKGFSYEPGHGGKPAMTGVGILCLSLTGQHESELLPRAGDYLLKADVNKQWGGSHFFYCNYYCTQAMFQLGDEYWDQWATKFFENALQHQRDDGSWGDPYSTTMTVLAMTVSYRQLPVYQR